MMGWCCAKILTGALLLLATEPLWGGPPFLTDDPVPVDYQNWELYLGSQHFYSDGDWSGTAPHIELNYGVVTNVQLHIIAPLGYNSPASGTPQFGYSDTELGVKFKLLDETPHIPEIGIFPLLEVPTGSTRHELGSGHLQAFLPVWLQKSWGPWTAYGGGGYGINPGAGNQDWGFVGALLQRQVFTNAIVGAEVYHQTAPETHGPSNTAFNIGTIVDLSEHHHLLFSAGRSIDGPIDFQCYVAFQFTFDNSVFSFLSHPRP
ncbi:MAG TPA: hypothetical protein VHH88_05725 [Verrucomicrobiae bacterium]|nr:hypothetical protein [Verrucomicrobiae bacterium]